MYSSWHLLHNFIWETNCYEVQYNISTHTNCKIICNTVKHYVWNSEDELWQYRYWNMYVPVELHLCWQWNQSMFLDQLCSLEKNPTPKVIQNHSGKIIHLVKVSLSHTLIHTDDPTLSNTQLHSYYSCTSALISYLILNLTVCSINYLSSFIQSHVQYLEYMVAFSSPSWYIRRLCTPHNKLSKACE